MEYSLSHRLSKTTVEKEKWGFKGYKAWENAENIFCNGGIQEQR